MGFSAENYATSKKIKPFVVEASGGEEGDETDMARSRLRRTRMRMRMKKDEDEDEEGTDVGFKYGGIPS
ncbi:hypothetical protein RHMOL_Rhmol11G0045200 [Rhododendron molle]|uniref:Uncharacterized protein n=1 Tax=Rhododendron molle TaxID=49168 RepID=A0ACC0LPM7_RHOML|nr:hypothetical protein RHMOL_Rhmol11G0045200 [Rhododendron molle]